MLSPAPCPSLERPPRARPRRPREFLFPKGSTIRVTRSLRRHLFFLHALEFAAIVGCSCFATHGADAQVISPNIRVSQTTLVENEPALACCGDTLVGVWFIATDGRAGCGYSTDGGTTWTNAGFLPQSPDNQGHHYVCADGKGSYYAVVRVSTIAGWTISVLRGSFGSSGLSWHPLTHAIPPVPYGNEQGLDALQVISDSNRGLLCVTYSEVRRPR